MSTSQDCTSLGLLSDEYLTLKEASSLAVCDISPIALRAAIRRGQLAGRKFGNSWGIKCVDLCSYLNNRKVGRPKKPQSDT